jgi:hypothetical protein
MASKPRLRWCFHGSAIVRSYDDAIAWLERVFGASVLEYSDLTDEPLIGRRGGCNWIGDMALELIEPTRPDSGGAVSWSASDRACLASRSKSTISRRRRAC